MKARLTTGALDSSGIARSRSQNSAEIKADFNDQTKEQKDRFQSATNAITSDGDSAAVKPPSPQEKALPKAKTLAAPEKVVTAERTENSAPLTILQEPESKAVPEESEGFTFGELAKSASRGLKKLIFGDPLKPFKKELSDINKAETQAKKLKTDAQFAAKTEDFRKRLAAGETLDDLRVEAYAVAREAARQATEMRAYDCQVLGALAMDDGHIAEMRTGEGKTLTAVLPLYLNALAGKGAHLVTVNETLAKRDADWMGPIFEKLGMTVGCVTDGLSLEEKKAGYNCDVTYVSDRALGFDFLRDQTAVNIDHRVQRGHFFALIDEVDEVLIDEARTPMILSGQASSASDDYLLFSQIIKTLKPGEDYKINEDEKLTWFTEGGNRFVEAQMSVLKAHQDLKIEIPGTRGQAKAQKALDNALKLRAAIRQENKAQLALDDIDEEKPNILKRAVGRNGKYDPKLAEKAEKELEQARKERERLTEIVKPVDLYSLDNCHRVHYAVACLEAEMLYELGDDYSIEGDELKILDGNKGRISQGKRFSQGLHQALEAKEGLTVKQETRTISSITMPELVGLYERKSGMTGTGKTSENEFLEFYGLDVVQIPTNKPILRKDLPDLVFPTKEAKRQWVVQEAMTQAKEGRPVLVGTISVKDNQELAALFLEAGWPLSKLQILNADRLKGGVDFKDPAAGHSGAITLTTGDRAKKVDFHKLNYKKIYKDAMSHLAKGQSLVIDLEHAGEANQVRNWLSSSVATKITKEVDPNFKGVQIIYTHEKPPAESPTQFPGLSFRDYDIQKPQLVGINGKAIETSQSAPAPKEKQEPKLPENFARLSRDSYRVESPLSLTLDDNNIEEVVQKAMAAFEEGVPVVVQSKSQKGLALAAENFLDRGLGQDAIPMVCDGKEKENTMISMAGRSEIITIATNMAGRGANVKPDLVAVHKIATAAYYKAQQEEAVTVALNKRSEAVKLQRLMSDHIAVRIADETTEAKKGEVLLVYGEQAEQLTNASLKAEDFKTHGLYVIGTERGTARRIDDQLIGRSGRQGDEGTSIFAISPADDIPRAHGEEQVVEILKHFTHSQEGLSDPEVIEAMDEIQKKVESKHFDQRSNAAKYQKVDREQRETYYTFREEVLNGEIDALVLIAQYGAEGIANLVQEKLGDKKKFEASELKKVLAKVSAEIKVPLAYEGKDKGKVKRKQLVESLYEQMDRLLDHPRLWPEKLKEVTLKQMDLTWADHLNNMEAIKQNVPLRAMDGRQPELIYGEAGFEVFEGTIDLLKARMARNILPAVADVHRKNPLQSD